MQAAAEKTNGVAGLLRGGKSVVHLAVTGMFPGEGDRGFSEVSFQLQLAIGRS